MGPRRKTFSYFHSLLAQFTQLCQRWHLLFSPSLLRFASCFFFFFFFCVCVCVCFYLCVVVCVWNHRLCERACFMRLSAYLYLPRNANSKALYLGDSSTHVVTDSKNSITEWSFVMICFLFWGCLREKKLAETSLFFPPFQFIFTVLSWVWNNQKTSCCSCDSRLIVVQAPYVGVR